MRRFIDIITERMAWETELQLGYQQFEQRWEDHVQPDMIADAPLLSFAQYVDYAHDIVEELGRIPLYRGMRLLPEQLENLQHLGVHWSREFEMAKGFSHSGWSIYDERFSKPGEGSLPIMIAIAPVGPDQTDIVETLAVTVYGGEDEVCLKRNQTVQIAAVYIDGVLQEGHPLVGQTRLT